MRSCEGRNIGANHAFGQGEGAERPRQPSRKVAENSMTGTWRAAPGRLAVIWVGHAAAFRYRTPPAGRIDCTLRSSRIHREREFPCARGDAPKRRKLPSSPTGRHESKELNRPPHRRDACFTIRSQHGPRQQSPGRTAEHVTKSSDSNRPIRKKTSVGGRTSNVS
jgi:hypothetical protein